MALTITWTRPALRLPLEVRQELERRLELLHGFFPEMKRVMRIGITRAYDGLAFQSDEGRIKLMVDIHKARLVGAWRMPTYWTLAHELMHLAQFNTKGIPGGERACDMFALARLTPELIDDSPSYLVVPPPVRRKWNLEHARLAHSLSEEALRKRSRGLRLYMTWWEDEFERRVARMPSSCRRQTPFSSTLLRIPGGTGKHPLASSNVARTK